MIITRSELIPEKNVGAFAWWRLKRFHNVSYVANIIADEQKTPARHKDNVRKQAEQVRYCLQQAQEYFEASKIVSLATKPTLLYYSVMSPALAELLMKQSGDSSLDRAREQHRHHGLVPNIQPPRGGVTMLDVVAGSMSASPLLHDGGGRGTFELWHKTSRRHPLAGLYYEPPLTAFRVMLLSEDKRLPRIDTAGVTSRCLVLLAPWLYMG